MFYPWILTSSLLILEIIIVRTTEANSLPTAGTFNSNLRFPSAAATALPDAHAGLDEDDEYSLSVSRGGYVLSSTQTQTGHYRDITVTLTAFNETFILDVELNTYLFASTYIEKAITISGEIYNDVNHVTGHCYYTGKVRNRIQSTAAVSTCKGVTGYFAIGNVSYHIEPKSDDLNGRHRVFRNRDDDKTIFRCGTDSQLRWLSRLNASSSSFGRSTHRMKRSFLYPQDEDKVDKIVEVYVANAKSQYIARSSDVNTVYRRTKDIVNIASLDYQPLGIYLVLVGVEVWTDRDQFTIIESNVDGALYSWYNYRQNSINPYHYNDNGVLINSVAFYGGVVGKAIVGSMCSNQYSGSMVSDLSGQPAAAGATMAHEMGHNFGQQHDTDSCSCSDPFANNRCIMYPSSNANRPATKWSACSLATFTTSFSQGLDVCLYNIPQTIFQSSSPACGNGIVEDGEQCDCGNAPSSECSNTCCNNATCQLRAPAACAYGRCCDISRCQLKSSGTECRSKSSDCDLSESCNGVDARCPTDSYKPDGTDCTNLDAAYCYQGQCRSYRSQCELLWGPGTQVSNNLCYTNFNTAGKHYGNCGLTWGANATANYIPCDANNVMCGKLQCQNTDSNKLYYYQSYYLLSSASIGSYSCHSVIFDFGTGTPDPGLVPNGAKCGDRQMCINQRCITVTISPQTTPTTITSTSRTTTTTSTTTTTKPTTTTLTTFVTTEDYNATSPEGNVPGRLTRRQIELIIGLTVGLFFGLLFLILLAILGYRYRRNLRTFSNRKIRVYQPKPVAVVDPPEGVYQNNTFENCGYTSNEQKAYDVLFPSRRAPVPPNSSFPITISDARSQQPHYSVYSNFSDISATDAPWFSETEDSQPTPIAIYTNSSEACTSTQLPTVSLGVAPKPLPKPPTVNHSPAKEDTSGQYVRNNKPPQLPVKPSVIAQSKGCTLLPPQKPQILKSQPSLMPPDAPIPPVKPHGKLKSGKSTTATQPPTAAARNPPKPSAYAKPPMKPSTAANQTPGSSNTESSETAPSMQELMKKFGGNTRKHITSSSPA